MLIHHNILVIVATLNKWLERFDKMESLRNFSNKMFNCRTTVDSVDLVIAKLMESRSFR